MNKLKQIFVVFSIILVLLIFSGCIIYGGSMPIIQNTQSQYTIIDSFSGNRVHVAIVPIGVWDMDTLIAKNITFSTGNLITKIISVKAIIIDDANEEVDILEENLHDLSLNGGSCYMYFNAGNTIINVNRIAGGYFDNANYNDGAINRGYIYITYIE